MSWHSSPQLTDKGSPSLLQGQKYKKHKQHELFQRLLWTPANSISKSNSNLDDNIDELNYYQNHISTLLVKIENEMRRSLNDTIIKNENNVQKTIQKYDLLSGELTTLLDENDHFTNHSG